MNTLSKFQALGCSTSVRIHFLHSHVDFSQNNLGAVSEEHGERFHQDIKDKERKYQGRWDKSMRADYCWMLTQDRPKIGHKRRTSKRSFKGKRERT